MFEMCLNFNVKPDNKDRQLYLQCQMRIEKKVLLTRLIYTGATKNNCDPLTKRFVATKIIRQKKILIQQIFC